MSEVIRVLQLGTENWKTKYELPEYVQLEYAEVFRNVPRTPYDIVFVDRKISDEEIHLLHRATKAYTLFVTDKEVWSDEMQYFFSCKKGQRLLTENIQSFLLHEVRNYFSKPYGEKFRLHSVAIAQGFNGKVSWDGNYCVNLEGNYGEELSQIVYWRNNIPVFEGQAIEFWLEYKKDPEVEIALSITQFRSGAVSMEQQRWNFTEQELENPVIIDNQMATGPIFISLLAKGSGKLQIIALHDRYSRRGHGAFLPGGKRYVTSDREEIFYYFDPGDLKPPLNVYFSGYKTLQGFEGYYMMRKMGAPFLLIAEPRLEGGSFYMGSKEFEAALKDILEKHMQELKFTREQVIFSGLSMGTYGALYYGCDIRPHAMILGKPLASIGDVAENERLHRPGGFPTSLDVLQYLTGNTDDKAVWQLNNRFWGKFEATDWGKSKFVVSYMIEDDYDMTAYNELISHVMSDGVQVYGKGIHGRHNDATGLIAGWFKSQYDKILREDFGRGAEG
ncbi:MAG: accessory Sec system protein Asp2 [Lachnospiraceae bacterium]|nr:accessory Sec system protein Asp2 [Lachnospiraceae bacterium]